MSTLAQLIILAIAGTLIGLLIKQYRPEQGLLLSIAVVGALVIITTATLSPIITFIQSLADTIKLDEDILSPIFKSVGIAILIKIAAELCKDAKEMGIASALEIGGAVLVIYVSMPLFSSVLQLIHSLM